jgi:hypothetical protein
MCHHFNVLLDVFHPHFIIVGEENIYLIEHIRNKLHNQEEYQVQLLTVNAELYYLGLMLTKWQYCNLNYVFNAI